MKQLTIPAVTITSGIIAIVVLHLLRDRTVGDLAQELGISERRLHGMIFQMDSMFMDDIAMFADALGVSVAELTLAGENAAMGMEQAAARVQFLPPAGRVEETGKHTAVATRRYETPTKSYIMVTCRDCDYCQWRYTDNDDGWDQAKTDCAAHANNPGGAK